MIKNVPWPQSDISLLSFIGQNRDKGDLMKNNVEDWKNNVNDISPVAATNPQETYTAFIYGTPQHWIFVARSAPNCASSFKH